MLSRSLDATASLLIFLQTMNAHSIVLIIELLLSSTLLEDLATNRIHSGSALSLSFNERPDTRGHGRAEEFFAMLSLMLTVNCAVSKAKQKLANLRLYKWNDVLKISAPLVLSYKLWLLLSTVEQV